MIWGYRYKKKSNNLKGINQRKKFRSVNEFIVEFSEGNVEFSGQMTIKLLHYKEENFENV